MEDFNRLQNTSYGRQYYQYDILISENTKRSEQSQRCRPRASGGTIPPTAGGRVGDRKPRAPTPDAASPDQDGRGAGAVIGRASHQGVDGDDEVRRG